MSRRHRAEKREVNPDAKFGDIVVTKFMNSLMKDGKKSAAESIVYGAFDIVQQKSKQDPIAATSVLPSKCVRAASAVPPIRSPSKSGRIASRRWPFAGLSSPRASAASTP
jgi:hypothetical protein